MIDRQNEQINCNKQREKKGIEKDRQTEITTVRQTDRMVDKATDR